MPTPTKGPRLGGSSAHQRLILANLATALFEHRSITTTEAKARRLRPFAERLITFAKRGDLHARRKVLTVITDKGVVHTLFTTIGPSFAARQGGYTRITKIGPRKGDNAPMAVIELVEDEAQAPARRRRARRPAPAAAPAQAAKTPEADVADEIEPVDETEPVDGGELVDGADEADEAEVTDHVGATDDAEATPVADDEGGGEPGDVAGPGDGEHA